MNKTHLKRYAPKARKDIIAAVTQRAQLLGLSAGSSSDAGQVLAEPVQLQGDVVLIGGRPWPANVLGRRDALLRRMQRDGYAHTLEAVAYTWFNRLAALRYMELHDYLGHGRRVLSSPVGSVGCLPEVLGHALALAEAGDLPGLTAAAVRELKLANQDGELYRRVLIAQCNALNLAMPFLFEAIADETELLLPDNLLLSDSIVAKLVDEIPEADWAEVEAIGWLYQFYISEKKDAVIGKVVKSEDIPAATQLFTPNWIVQYLVQNSVGRLWLMANPASTLAKEWPYYIQPAEQTPEVQAQLDALIQTRIREDGDSLNPETITVLDPACGSGHILVVAYDVLKAIYLERGYQPRTIPRLILEKNLYGLDIDDRAAQLAAFALLMKARADDRRLFADPPRLNVLSLQESKGLDLAEVAGHLAPHGLQRHELKVLTDTFEHAKTLGSLIQIPAGLNGQLAAMAEGLQRALREGDLYGQQAARDLLPLVWQGLVLGMQFDAVVANPPYMGTSYFNKDLKAGLGRKYKVTRSDLYVIFMQRSFEFLRESGLVSMITRQDWMHTRSYSDVRLSLAGERTLNNLVQLGAGAFEFISGEVTQAAAFTVWKESIAGYLSIFMDCTDREVEKEAQFNSSARYMCSCGGFPERLGRPLLYHLSEFELSALNVEETLSDKFTLREGIHTGDNGRFVRNWWEISRLNTSIDSNSFDALDACAARWIPYQKGGNTKRWYWGTDFVIRFDKSARTQMAMLTGHVRPSQDLYFLAGGTWSDVATKGFGVRYFGPGSLFDGAGPVVVGKNLFEALAIMNSSSFIALAQDVMPNLHFKCGTMQLMPFVSAADVELVKANAEVAIRLCKGYASGFEEQDCFAAPFVVRRSNKASLISMAAQEFINSIDDDARHLSSIEAKNNIIYAEAYGLSLLKDWTTSEGAHPIAPTTIEIEAGRLVSFAIGCMMGRYSLDEPGLIYANAGNSGFDPSRYALFPADADGILPLTGQSWFDDDAASRVREFLRTVWGTETLQENLAWLAQSLGTKGPETPDETIRRYLADKFFKDHLQTYKKRPIYWLFSSGKQGAFQALVYLHRYHDGTLARMRNQYVVPLTAKLQTRIDGLQADVRAAASTAARTKLNKQLESLRKQQTELLAYDEKLRHFADQRISLDLDDGVKVNYAKFGDLLAEVKAVTGGASDD